MRIDVLGTSAGWPVPRLGCRCEQCTSNDPCDRRLRPCLLLERRVLVDAGPDLYAQLLKADVVPDSIVITHSHGDHVLGLYELAKAGRLPLYCSPDTERQVRAMLPRVQLRMMRIAPGVGFDLGEGLRGQAFDVEHGRERTFGYRFTGRRGESLVYVPDLGAPPVSRLARDADLLMIDGSCRGTEASRGHLPIEQAIPVARTLKARRVLLTHIGHRAGLHAELERWLPDGFGVAHDGQRIDLEPVDPAPRGRPATASRR